MVQGDAELQRALFRSYGYSDQEMNGELRRRLMLLTILYECSDPEKICVEAAPLTPLTFRSPSWSGPSGRSSIEPRAIT